MAKSNANSKLQNVKAIKEMLAGKHKTQTRKSFGFTTSAEPTRKVGDEWIETNANGTKIKVKQKEGFRVKEPVNSIRDQINEILRMPDKCPECNKEMIGDEKRLNEKFWKTHKTCFDCVVVLETRLRAEGKFEEYERKKMYENAKSFFKTADSEVEIIKEALTGKLEFIQDKDGNREEFDQSDYKQKYLEYIDEQYKRFKKETLTDLKNKS